MVAIPKNRLTQYFAEQSVASTSEIPRLGDASPTPGVALDDWLEVVQHLLQKGVQIEVWYPTQATLQTAEEVQQFMTDRDAWAAENFGMTAEQYRDYIATEGRIMCDGVTAKRHPCKNTVAECYDPQTWLKHKSEGPCFCHLHRKKA